MLLVLDGASSLLWAAVQDQGTEVQTRDKVRDWMLHHHCRPKWIVADMAFFTKDWEVFWIHHGVQMMPTGARTPWPNRAETAVRLFKRQLAMVAATAAVDKTLQAITSRDIVRECCWARNTQLTISGYTPIELATGRRPPDELNLELLTPEQLSQEPLKSDVDSARLRGSAVKAHLEVRQATDLRRDLARHVQPSDGPFTEGERVFVWRQDKSKIKDKGEWIAGKVISQHGAQVRVELPDRLDTVNQSRVRRNFDPWHDVPLPGGLRDSTGSVSEPAIEVDLSPEETEDTGEAHVATTVAGVKELGNQIVQLVTKDITLPLTKRSNIKSDQPVRSLHFGAYTVQGSGVTQACKKHPVVLNKLQELGKTRPVRTEYLSIQLNFTKEMVVHKDKNNSGHSWTISFGTYRKVEGCGLPRVTSPRRDSFLSLQVRILCQESLVDSMIRGISGFASMAICHTEWSLSSTEDLASRWSILCPSIFSILKISTSLSFRDWVFRVRAFDRRCTFQLQIPFLVNLCMKTHSSCQDMTRIRTSLKIGDSRHYHSRVAAEVGMSCAPPVEWRHLHMTASL